MSNKSSRSEDNRAEGVACAPKATTIDSSLTRTRLAVAAVFASNGFIYANWTSRLPRIQEIYAMDNGQTGFALTALALGALVAMPLAGLLIVRGGSQRLTVYSSIAFALTVPVMALLPDYWALLLFLPLVGVSTGIMDVAMNAQAVEVEKRWGSPITSSFHAAFSGGMFLGAGAAAAFIALGFDLRAHLLTVAVLMLLLLAYALRHLLPDRPGREGDSRGASTHFGRAIVLLGVAAFCTMVAEGSMADWTPLYMTRVTLSAEAIAPVGQAAFSGAMFVGRVMGDALRARIGSLLVLRGGALVSLIGLLAAVVFPLPLVAIVGFALVGLGLSNIVPVVFSAASRVPGLRPGVGISSVSTLGYAAFLVGPPVIGFVADGHGLRVGLAVVVSLLAVLWGLTVGWRSTLVTDEPDRGR